MGKITWETTAQEIDEHESDGFYSGPVPPPSVYRFRISEIVHKEFRSGSTGLRVTLDLDDPRKEKSPYKGARLWENIVDTEGSRFRVKQFLDAIGATGKDWANTFTDSEGKVTKIGRVKITESLYIRGRTKYGTYNGEQKAEIAAFLVKGETSDAEDDSDDSDDDTSVEEAPF